MRETNLRVATISLRRNPGVDTVASECGASEEQWFDFAFEDLQREARLELRMRGSRRDFGRTLACTLWRAAEVWVWM